MYKTSYNTVRFRIGLQFQMVFYHNKMIHWLVAVHKMSSCRQRKQSLMLALCHSLPLTRPSHVVTRITSYLRALLISSVLKLLQDKMNYKKRLSDLLLKQFHLIQGNMKGHC